MNKRRAAVSNIAFFYLYTRLGWLRLNSLEREKNLINYIHFNLIVKSDGHLPNGISNIQTFSLNFHTGMKGKEVKENRWMDR